MRVQKARIKTRTRKVPGSSPDRTRKNRFLTWVRSCISLIRSGPGQHQNPDRTRILPSLLRSVTISITNPTYSIFLKLVFGYISLFYGRKLWCNGSTVPPLHPVVGSQQILPWIQRLDATVVPILCFIKFSFCNCPQLFIYVELFNKQNLQI